MHTALFAGLGLGFSLIVAIGAQNLFVLRQGLRREHVFAVAAICAVSDAVLIALGVSGIGLAVQAMPWLIGVVRWAGAGFLLVYGLLAARRAWRPTGAVLADQVPEGRVPEVPEGSDASAHADADAAPAASRSLATRTRALPVVLTCLALTWLNPHVYLDTVFLVGSVASSHGDARWVFAAGAMLASVAWFFGLGFGARGLGRWLSTPRAWRILDGIVAVVMIALAISLVVPS